MTYFVRLLPVLIKLYLDGLSFPLIEFLMKIICGGVSNVGYERERERYSCKNVLDKRG